jgi:NADPH:quinone reductase-like Zn-dependent oxidoreductase
MVLDDGSRWPESSLPQIDAVIGLIGGEHQTLSFAVLSQGGTLTATLAPPDQSAAAEHGVRAAFFLVDATTVRLTRLAAMIETCALRTSVGAVLPLAAAKLAHEMLEASRPQQCSKIVLRMSE